MINTLVLLRWSTYHMTWLILSLQQDHVNNTDFFWESRKKHAVCWCHVTSWSLSQLGQTFTSLLWLEFFPCYCYYHGLHKLQLLTVEDCWTRWMGECSWPPLCLALWQATTAPQAIAWQVRPPACVVRMGSGQKKILSVKVRHQYWSCGLACNATSFIKLKPV